MWRCHGRGSGVDIELGRCEYRTASTCLRCANTQVLRRLAECATERDVRRSYESQCTCDYWQVTSRFMGISILCRRTCIWIACEAACRLLFVRASDYATIRRGEVERVPPIVGGWCRIIDAWLCGCRTLQDAAQWGGARAYLRVEVGHRVALPFCPRYPNLTIQTGLPRQ